MAVDTVQSSTAVDSNGNSYTSAISNDKLTNTDFLKLMLEELKQQDPTKPMDSAQMLTNQMQMSNIETNNATIDAMKSLQTSFAQTALASAANIIGQVVENGEKSDTGMDKQFRVSSVMSQDGTLNVEAYEILGLTEDNKIVYANEPTLLQYNNITRILDGSLL
ncbi:MAG: flagellar hook assembly protein FlgD [Candidatus Marinarcus sp.]|uniref:flagellar hook assembly protein FlgD n=1 Tax=Candidatus Marinarcus sp. TaxID=3100987 RepID=UPI003AFFD22E